MNDLIERQSVIDNIEERKYANGWTNVSLISELNRLEGYVMRLPSSQQWIPLKERLPKIGEVVLLSEPHDMFLAEYHGDGDPSGLWTIDGLHHFIADVTDCAWMPSPKPYKRNQ